MRHAIITASAPQPIGPYSQAVVSEPFVFTAGQVGIDPNTRQLVAGGAAAEARQALNNVRAILEAAGSDLAHVVKTTLYLSDMQDFAAVNAVYAESFAAPYPARTTIAAAGLPAGAHFEIETVARLK
jgi:2-iminobutanoate/2-iminopropanoate deaminase